MTPQEVITQARVLINDDKALMPERYSDTEMLGFVNQAIKRACMVCPDLFIISDDITPTADQVEQELPANVTRIMEVHRVVGGGAVGEVDKETMDRSAPDWTTETPETPVNWTDESIRLSGSRQKCDSYLNTRVPLPYPY